MESQKSLEQPPIKLAPHLLDAYEEHCSKGDFEVIFVAAYTEKQEEHLLLHVDEDEEKFFSQQCSRMPWLAVPFSDVGGRRKLTETMKPQLERFDSFQFCLVFSANGRKLVKHAEQDLSMRTTDLYLSFKQIAEDKPLLPPDDDDGLSLQSLLAGPNRDFLISNQGNKVHTSHCLV